MKKRLHPDWGFSFYWSFVASSSQVANKKIEGLVRAPSSMLAAVQVKRMGFVRPVVKFDFETSLQTGFGFFPSDDFDLREKGRLYRTLGQRLKRDGSLVSALESAQEYLQDGRLKAGVAIMAAQINDGQPVYQGMIGGGFSLRDAMVVRALGDSGAMFKAFQDLAVESKARHDRNSALNAAMRMPIIMVFAVYSGLPLFFFGLGPKMSAFFNKLGAQSANIPADIQAIYESVAWANSNVFLALLIWISVGAAGIALWKSSFWSSLAMRSKTFRDLSEKTEQASIWSVYGLMYGAGIPSQEICEVMRPACRLEKNKDSLRKMARRLSAGADDREAVEVAGFPRFVVSGFRAAKDSGVLADGLESFAAMLNEDIEMLTEKTKALMQLVSLVVMALTVLSVFYIVYYPIAGPVLNSL